MTNEQYSNMMVAIATIEAKIEKLEALLEAFVIENKLVVAGDIKPEHLSNFWNEDRLKEIGCLGDNSIPPKPFIVQKSEDFRK